MNALHRRIVFVVVCCFVASTFAASGDQTALQDQHSRVVLSVMSHKSTLGHPDQEGLAMGLQLYAKGDYRGAMKHFLVGARYADKLSQLCIGMLYLNGEGVRKDPVAAYAWMSIAAERDYPTFIASRDALGAKLDAQQRQLAAAMFEQLSAEYGDIVAKPRMVSALRQGMVQISRDTTGSRLGFMAQPVKTIAEKEDCDTSDMGAITGCGGAFSDARWDPAQYFKARDSAWSGTVTVSPLQEVASPKVQATSTDSQPTVP
jgi:uncharacterized protein